MSTINRNMSLTGEPPKAISTRQKLSVALGMIGLFILILAWANVDFPNKSLFLSLALGLISAGTVLFAVDLYMGKHAGIKNDGVYFKSMTSRGVLGWATGIFLTLFYILLYWFPGYLGFKQNGENEGLIALFDPLSRFISGGPASQWFVYGTFYTLAILIFGVKFILKYRHSRYEILRTCSVMFFQLSFAFIIPEIMARLNQPYYDFKNIWPLNYDLFAGYRINEFLSSGNVGLFMLFLGIASIFIITPILTYKYGKRWYCSWVCGCGGLAETAGDPYRHLSDKRQSAWKIERWVVHSVVVFVTVMTIAVVYSYLAGNESAGITQWSNIENKAVFMNAEGDKALNERLASAEENGAKQVVILTENSPQTVNVQAENLDYIVINKAENQEALDQIRQQKAAKLQGYVGNKTTTATITGNTQTQFYDTLWLSKEVFLWGVVALLTLVFTWVILFRRKQLAKDAKYGAIGYFVVVMAILFINYFSGSGRLFFFDAYELRSTYGFVIGSIFSGVIGVGFYPIFGSRVWCRFGCPMAAILGFQQRLFSRFRITTNGGQCISCGNCSTYCEMGIDVRAYAQKGENIVRSSCVGCGICSEVCPRGVLKLENDSYANRINSKEVLLGSDVNLMDYVNQK